ncbi:cysteine permease [Campylobacter canadensis]|uniref:Cysteine permease n=1 Tax=Campylobacter canadensis TaxID=449520 RepID=A0ABS7WP68_9BACT|nr:cysteine permease [Campylobacter canadensis]MBZ7986567.1 cysteine permease [Campylobacter canadensis]MBZ7994028.1 cysteine permease [Campylobacter canadensis]MBZ7995969.1 cysteine permease [Campylobacter canadensis]MBZ7997603.1 cysteine permease [Campylobacter canadensis]MBZ7999359.1 cysteine permease [Campylobacter canadensis]
MQRYILSYSDTLDDYILNQEFCKLAKVSQNAYKFWSNVKTANYPNSRIVFLEKTSIILKHQDIKEKCTDLSGLILASSFCAMSNLAPSHLNAKNGSKLLDVLDLVEICGVKFINLRNFYKKLKIPHNAHIYIEKCCYFAPEPFEKKIKLTPTLCLGYY